MINPGLSALRTNYSLHKPGHLWLSEEFHLLVPAVLSAPRKAPQIVHILTQQQNSSLGSGPSRPLSGDDGRLLSQDDGRSFSGDESGQLSGDNGRPLLGDDGCSLPQPSPRPLAVR